MTRIKNYLLNLYYKITGSIAFYPALIALGFLGLAIIAVNLRGWGFTDFLRENTPRLVLNDADTARTVLSTLIGGLLSLMVFSFSMVMLLLNQASSNYSPRLLPGLVSEKMHQMVLGTYLGTIVYCIFILISILPDEEAYQLPGFAVLTGVVFGIICLGMFVYFIHSISQRIQVTSILQNVFQVTQKRLLKQAEKEERQHSGDFPDLSDKHVIKGSKSGYFQGVNEQTLTELVARENLCLTVKPLKGMYLLQGLPVLYTDKKVNEEVAEELLSCLIFNKSERVDENYVLGFKQITEIAVKAMSPGINDPATALSAIDYLTELFALRMKLDDEEFLADSEGKLCVCFKIISFSELMYFVLLPLRRYAKHDVTVMLKALRMLEFLSQQPMKQESYTEVLSENVNLIQEDIQSAVENKTDLGKLTAAIAVFDK